MNGSRSQEACRLVEQAKKKMCTQCKKLGVGTHPQNPSAGEAETERPLGIDGQPVC